MINILKRIQRDLTLATSGIQETVITIADHVNQHVQKVKLGFDANTLETEIRHDQITLGRKIHAHPEENLRKRFQESEIEKLSQRITLAKKQLESTEGTVSPYEALHDFERLLIQSDFVIQNIVILDGYDGMGKTIQEIEPPPRMLIFFIKKGKRIELACGNTVIDIRDEIIFLCSKENIQNYIAFWK